MLGLKLAKAQVTDTYFVFTEVVNLLHTGWHQDIITSPTVETQKTTSKCNFNGCVHDL